MRSALALGLLLLPQAKEEFSSNLVIGYSQVQQWYRAFEAGVDDARWELLWNGGAGVDRWSDPEFAGWKNALVSPCRERSGDPDRVVLSVSGPYGDKVDTWAEKIRATVANVRTRYKNARRIVILPVVGGHDHHACPAPGRGGTVRAASQHPHIRQAIEKVVAEDKTGLLALGPCPHVRSCADYRDALGHLAAGGEGPVGREIAEFFTKEGRK